MAAIVQDIAAIVTDRCDGHWRVTGREADMRLVIFGASGRTGQDLLIQALARGHDVTAVVRSPDCFGLRYDRLNVVKGDALNGESFADALDGQDAVLSSLGVTGLIHSLRPMTFYEESARAIIGQMRTHDVRRLVLVSSVGVTHDRTQPLWYRATVKRMLRYKYADMQRMEAAVAASGLDWTVVRASRLVDGPLTQHYRVGGDGSLPHIGAISHADLGNFVAAEATDRAFIGRAVVVSY